MADLVSFTIEQGATFLGTITPVVPVDYSGYYGVCQIRAENDPTSPVIASPVVLVTPGVLGVHTIALTRAETLALPVSGATRSDVTSYQYDIFLTNGAETETIKTANGVIQVIPCVTHSYPAITH